MSGNRNKTIAFNYFGGKFTWIEYLYANFPAQFTHMVDLFAGSMVVSLNYHGRVIRTANEINGEITNFFIQLRDHEEELLRALRLTPYSEQEYIDSWIFDDNRLTDLERARRFYVRVRQSFFGLGAQRQNKGWHMSKQHVNAQGGESVSRWKNGVEKLYSVAGQIRDNFQIMNDDYQTAIDRLDFPGAFFYCDPPYPLECRNSKNDYHFEFTDEDHRQLADRLHRIGGMAMVSGYDCPLMNELYKDWHKVRFPFKRTNIRSNIKNGSGTIMQECIWMNYEPHVKTQQLF
ncbi:MAG: DNA adenine methylase [Bacteroides cellulosilyticus]|nr:DNA adenine methylase [Bacteroides cellulosilyticus]